MHPPRQVARRRETAGSSWNRPRSTCRRTRRPARCRRRAPHPRWPGRRPPQLPGGPAGRWPTNAGSTRWSGSPLRPTRSARPARRPGGSRPEPHGSLHGPPAVDRAGAIGPGPPGTHPGRPLRARRPPDGDLCRCSCPSNRYPLRIPIIPGGPLLTRSACTRNFPAGCVGVSHPVPPHVDQASHRGSVPKSRMRGFNNDGPTRPYATHSWRRPG